MGIARGWEALSFQLLVLRCVCAGKARRGACFIPTAVAVAVAAAIPFPPCSRIARLLRSVLYVCVAAQRRPLMMSCRSRSTSRSNQSTDGQIVTLIQPDSTGWNYKLTYRTPKITSAFIENEMKQNHKLTSWHFLKVNFYRLQQQSSNLIGKPTSTCPPLSSGIY